MDKGKRAKVEEEEGSELDAELVQAIEKLQEVQDELERVNEEASDKVLEVEQFYNEIRRPVYNKRNEIINNIPDFWLTAFLSHPVLCDLLTEEDQKVFKYLESLDVEDFKDVKSGYSISFNFRENPYFSDSKLTKVFSFSDDGTTSVSGTQPNWKAGMDLTNGVVPEKEGLKRPHVEDSFFKWFSDTEAKVSLDGIQDEVAEVIKDDLWPNPLKYFNNEQDEDGFESGEQDDDDEDDDDDDTGKADDEDEEPDEEDEDEES
jgi:template-activating factor I